MTADGLAIPLTEFTHNTRSPFVGPDSPPVIYQRSGTGHGSHLGRKADGCYLPESHEPI